MKPFRPVPAFFLLFLCLECTPYAPGPEGQFALGTGCLINLFDRGKPELYARVFARLHELDDILSANRKNTDLDRVNQNAGLTPVKVRSELIEVLEAALEYAEKSRGFLDPTVGPLVKLWGIGTDSARVPEEDEILEALNLINHHEVEINRGDGTVFLKRPGMALDLGAIAKGYAADEIVGLLGKEGVERAMIDLGGNIFAMGEKAGGGFWNVGIQDPLARRGELIGILRVKNMSVVTSGMYERFHEEEGNRYHHIFSVGNGRPVENELLSVTIAANKSIDADALSTAAFALGWEQGRELIAGVPGAQGIFVFRDMSVRLTGEAENFTLDEGEYYMIEP